MRGFVWAVLDESRREIRLSHAADGNADLYSRAFIADAIESGFTVVSHLTVV